MCNDVCHALALGNPRQITFTPRVHNLSQVRSPSSHTPRPAVDISSSLATVLRAPNNQPLRNRAAIINLLGTEDQELPDMDFFQSDRNHHIAEHTHHDIRHSHHTTERTPVNTSER